MIKYIIYSYFETIVDIYRRNHFLMIFIGYTAVGMQILKVCFL